MTPVALLLDNDTNIIDRRDGANENGLNRMQFLHELIQQRGG